MDGFVAAQVLAFGYSTYSTCMIQSCPYIKEESQLTALERVGRRCYLPTVPTEKASTERFEYLSDSRLRCVTYVQ